MQLRLRNAGFDETPDTLMKTDTHGFLVASFSIQPWPAPLPGSLRPLQLDGKLCRNGSARSTRPLQGSQAKTLFMGV